MEPEFSSVFELEPTLKRINGNVPLLKKLMGSFAAHYRNAGSEIAGLVRSRDLAGAEMMAHRLAAAAAQLGAMALSNAAGDMERALKDRSVDQVDAQIQGVEHMVAQATTLAAAYSSVP